MQISLIRAQDDCVRTRASNCCSVLSYDDKRVDKTFFAGFLKKRIGGTLRRACSVYLICRRCSNTEITEILEMETCDSNGIHIIRNQEAGCKCTHRPERAKEKTPMRGGY